MTELLIIKAGREYYRIRENDYEVCPFDKASVFPLARAHDARECCRHLQESGAAAKLMKLTIVEEPYND